MWDACTSVLVAADIRLDRWGCHGIDADHKINRYQTLHHFMICLLCELVVGSCPRSLCPLLPPPMSSLRPRTLISPAYVSHLCPVARLPLYLNPLFLPSGGWLVSVVAPLVLFFVLDYYFFYYWPAPLSLLDLGVFACFDCLLVHWSLRLTQAVRLIWNKVNITFIIYCI